jgi:DNA-binding transcriptional ArsR family regulator
MVERLAKGEATVKQLAEPFPMSLPAVLQHLQLLESTGLVKTEKAGRVRTCSLNREKVLDAERWFVDRRKTWEGLMDRMADVVNAEGEY